MRIRLIVSVTIILAILVYSFILPYFSPYTDPMRWNQAPMDQPPSPKYPFGTSSLGQDLFWVLSFGLRNSITFGAATACISILIALFLGVISGYSRGKMFMVFTVILDSFCVTPVLPIVVLISALWTGATSMLIFALILSFFAWAHPARAIRSLILSLRERTFIRTALFSGFTTLDIIIHEYLPFVFPLLLVNAISITLFAIGMETTLAILGLVSLGVPSIGTIIFWAQSYQALTRGIWWWILIPIFLLLTFIVAMYSVAYDIYKRRL